jgi:hypothetical protein
MSVDGGPTSSRTRETTIFVLLTTYETLLTMSLKRHVDTDSGHMHDR